MGGLNLTYAVVTPTFNESANLGPLARCLSEQTLAPAAWVVVDDGSEDETLAVARVLASELPWVEVLQSPNANLERERRGRHTGSEGAAFEAGARAVPRPVDVVLKVDADVSFESDFMERLIGEFAADPSLGMASGLMHERHGTRWVVEGSTAGHVYGPCRAYRWPCFEAVTPFERRLAWDAIDVVAANVLGWRTRRFPELVFRHHRRIGTREPARWREHAAQGRAAHYLGYRFSYLALRALYRAARDPSSAGMIAGYLDAAARREARCADALIVMHVRRQQRVRHLGRRAREALGRTAD